MKREVDRRAVAVVTLLSEATRESAKVRVAVKKTLYSSSHVVMSLTTIRSYHDREAISHQRW